MLKTQPLDPGFDFDAALYFIEGQYLYLRKKESEITSKFLNVGSIVSALRNLDMDSGWIEPGIVRMGLSKENEWYIYWQPSQKVTLLFGSTETISVSIVIPALVMVVTGDGVRMVALKTKVFNPNDMAFAAPFPNIKNNKICFGHNTLDKLKPSEVWDLFLKTPFTESYIESKSKRFPSDVRQQYIYLSKMGKKRYPLSDLVPLGPFSKLYESWEI